MIPRLAAAGTIRFTADMVDFEIQIFNDSTIEVPKLCFGVNTCSDLDGLFAFDSTCADIGDGLCQCDYYVVEHVTFETFYNVDGDQLRTSFGEDYDLCLQGDRLSLTHFTPGEQDLENYTLVRAGD